MNSNGCPFVHAPSPPGMQVKCPYCGEVSPPATGVFIPLDGIDWKSRALAAEARTRELEEGLRPFAEAAVHLHPSQPDDGVTLDGIEVRHWRRAAFLVEKEGGSSGGRVPCAQEHTQEDRG